MHSKQWIGFPNRMIRYKVTLTVVAFLIVMKFGMPNGVKVLADEPEPFSKIAFFSRQGQSEALHVIDPVTAKEVTFPFSDGSITWWLPAWSPTCDRLALDRFEGDQKVVSVLAYGTDGISNVILPDGPITITAYFPTWSPDGTAFAFQGLDTEHLEGNFEVYAVSTLHGSIVNLTNNTEYDLYPDWSPDGKQITFISITKENNPERYFDIYVVNADGSSMKAIYIDPKTDDSGPLWSPDGNSIAFLTQASPGSGHHRLLLTDKTGSTVTPLTDNTTYNIVGSYAWSNDGKYIAFSSKNADDDIQIFLLDMSSKSVEPLTDVPKTINQYASWSPDDSQLVFNSNRDGDFEIYTLDMATKAVTQLTNNDYGDIFPAWSPKSCYDN
jgi:Tol biopolymer transport system component